MLHIADYKTIPLFEPTLGLGTKRQMFDLADEQTLQEYAFNMQWHYALGIVSTADDKYAYLASKTLWNLRKRVVDAAGQPI